MAKKSAAAAESAQAATEAASKQPKEPKKTKEAKAKAAPAAEKASAEKAPTADKAVAAEKVPATEAAPSAPGAEKPDAEAAPAAAEPAKKKGKAPGKAPRRGKKLRNQLRHQRQKIVKEGPLPLKRAINLLKQMKRARFDETVEVHMSLGIDTSQSEQMIRGSVALPHGLGKAKRVVVFCQGENVAKAKAAGADYAGADDLIEKIQKENWLDFDVALATQDLMGKVSRLGKVLGPRGLMPTPKAGTVIPATGDVASAVREFKAGKVEYRTDKGGNVHAGVGKLSFDEDKLAANITAFIDQIKAVKPAGVKGNYVKSVTLSATMSPGIPISL